MSDSDSVVTYLSRRSTDLKVMLTQAFSLKPSVEKASTLLGNPLDSEDKRKIFSQVFSSLLYNSLILDIDRDQEIGRVGDGLKIGGNYPEGRRSRVGGEFPVRPPKEEDLMVCIALLNSGVYRLELLFSSSDESIEESKSFARLYHWEIEILQGRTTLYHEENKY